MRPAHRVVRPLGGVAAAMLVGVWLAGARTVSTQQVAQPSTKRADAFYTQTQATRGKFAFNRNFAR